MDHDKSKFLTPLKVELIDQSKGIWQLTAPLVFWSGFFGQEIEVPAGFITDFASVPRIPVAYLLAGGDFQAPATLHDYLYRSGIVTRAIADGMLSEACVVSGVPAWRTFIAWLGVRLFGWAHYQKGGSDEQSKA